MHEKPCIVTPNRAFHKTKTENITTKIKTRPNVLESGPFGDGILCNIVDAL